MLGVSTGSVLGVSTGSVLGVSTGSMLGVSTGSVLGVSTGSVLGVSTGSSVSVPSVLPLLNNPPSKPPKIPIPIGSKNFWKNFTKPLGSFGWRYCS